MSHHHGSSPTVTGAARFALIGSPNSGKTTLFNALTGLRAKTGNYPGVTVSRFSGVTDAGGTPVVVEDLPGTYSLDPISPDERIVTEVLDPHHHATQTPDALIVVLDSTTLRRSLGLLAHVLQADQPVAVVVTFTDELTRRGGAMDVRSLSTALGVPALAVVAGARTGVDDLRDLMVDSRGWARPVVPPPTDPQEISGWVTSVLNAARYRAPSSDVRTQRIDRVLLHPVGGTAIFAAVMWLFFQVIFSVAAPLQGWIEEGFAWLGERVASGVSNPWIAGFLGEALIGGIGGVLVFLPQILLLFLMVSILEGVGYMSRAAFLMDRVMSRAGLEGRAFVALLSSLACAIPGIMATRTLPSARDRLATIMAAPLMTCSARLPVYVMLIAMLVPGDARFGPFSLQGSIMFALYLGGAVAAMTVAWVFSHVLGRRGPALPFYMEMPPYRVPSVRSVLLSMWDSARAFLKKVTTIILATSAILWLALNIHQDSGSPMETAPEVAQSAAAVTSVELERSVAANVGRALEPVFEPLGFDWRINIGVIASLSAREVFVATLGQVAAATDPENPGSALERMVWTSGSKAGEPLFTAPTIAALLVFFMFALQCMSTVGVMRRETGSWKWPAIAFGYMFVLAWVGAYAARTVVGALT